MHAPVRPPSEAPPRLARLGRIAAQATLPALVLIGAWLVTERLVNATGAPEGPARTAPETVYSVTAIDVAPATNRASLRAFGEVVAAESAELRVASPGEVVAIADNLDVGEVVAAGTALVTIDPFAYEGAVRDARAQLAEARAALNEAAARIGMERAAVASAEAQLGLAERDLARAEQLVRSGNVTEQGLDARRLTTNEREAALERARYTLAVEEAREEQQRAAVDRLEWTLEKAERALSDTVLSAPFAGIVREDNVALGRILAANDVAVSLIRADALDVRFVLSDQRYGRLIEGGSLIGTEIAVTWRIGDTPLAYTALVTRVGADITSSTGGVDVYARLALPGAGPAPRPGAFVEVRVPGRAHENSFRVPASALNGTSVFVIGAEDRLVERPVRVLALDGSDIIVEGPLAAGDAVVTTRLAEAGSGIKVRRVELDAPPPTAPDGRADTAAAPAPAAVEPEPLPPAPRRTGRQDRQRS